MRTRCTLFTCHDCHVMLAMDPDDKGPQRCPECGELLWHGEDVEVQVWTLADWQRRN